MTILIREANISDIQDIAEIHVDGWHGAYGGIVDQSFIDSLTVEKRVEQWSSRVKESNNIISFLEDEATGFVSYGPLKTPPAGMSKIRPLYSSEIYAIYLKAEFYRQGIGTLLLKQTVKNLLEMKHQSMCLWVMDKNKRACKFYEALGAQRVGKRMIEVGPSKVKEACYAWRDIKEVLDK